MPRPLPLAARFIVVLGLLGALGACGRSPELVTVEPSPTPRLEPPRIIGYFTSWGVAARGYSPSAIPADQLTHINYAFSKISYFGKCVLGDPSADIQKFYSARNSVDSQPDKKDELRGNFNQLIKLKQKYPHLKTLISIGGWTGSGKFSDVALTEESRQVFVQSCLELYLQKYAGVFDGIDLDWEYPVGGGPDGGRPEDKENFTLLLAEFRAQLDAQAQADGRPYLLTIAAPAGPDIIRNYALDQIHPYLDWINLMTYDYHGAWEKSTNFLAPLYKAPDDPSRDPVMRDEFNVDATVQIYLDGGVPADKLAIGIPFYGRGWKGVPDQNHGLYQLATGPAPSRLEPGAFSYIDIKKNYLPVYERFWHAEAGAPWIFNPDKGIMISYDDPESVGLKAAYVKEHGLGGVMFWELSYDGGDLVSAIHRELYP